uniref:C-type lectin domain-containing protein n=1 Tax=Nothobranchius pienaari TaxID=704102 RepID=A0A1A8MTR3_9TELE
MERVGHQRCGSDCDTLVSQEVSDDEDLKTCNQFNQSKLQVFLFRVSSWRRGRLAALILVVLAGVLLIADISLGVRYNNLKDAHLTLEHAERIGKAMDELQKPQKSAVKPTMGSHKQLDIDVQDQQETIWELEHQTKSSKAYQVQIEKMTKNNEYLKSHLPMTAGGCGRCPSGWILMNSACYFFHFSDAAGLKSWNKARMFCQMYGGDLVVIDSKDKQKAIINHLVHYVEPSKVHIGFWFGLSDSHMEGTWKWLDGTSLVEGFWMDGEPNDTNNEDCASVYAEKNFFKAWNDLTCEHEQKWICEKAPTSES